MSTIKDLAIANFNDGNKLYKGKLFDEALEQYQTAIKNDPTFYDAHFCVAKTQIRLGKIDLGISYFKKYIDLIPKDKQGDYLLGMTNILLKEGKSADALRLVEGLNIEFSQGQILKYLPIVLNNNRVNDAIHKLINIGSGDEVSSAYTKLLNNEDISDSVKNTLKNDNIVPRYFNSVKKINLLSALGVNHDGYKAIIEDATTLLEEIKKNKYSNYKIELDKVDELTKGLQLIVFEKAEFYLKSNNSSASNNLVSVLDKTKFNSPDLNSLKSKISSMDKDNKQKKTRKTALVASLIAVVLIGSYFGYKFFAKSQAKKETLRTNTVYGFTQYLDEYGDDLEIEKLRETKLYEDVLKAKRFRDYTELSSLYPNSKYLRNVTFEFDKGNIPNNLILYGREKNDDYKEMTGDQKITIKLPLGAKVRYEINKNEYLTINKAFTVLRDMTINEKFIKQKQLVLNDNFNSNKNTWTSFNESKQVYGRTKYKGVNVRNGELQIFNEFDENKFTISTINFPKINRSKDFEIEASITRNGMDEGTFVLFGSSYRAFNYVGINKNSRFLFGYNDWDNSSDNWVKLSNGWDYNQSISGGSNATNIIRIEKHNKFVTFYINEVYVGGMDIKRWYGNRIGFGINDKTKSNINYIKVYSFKKRIKAKFEKNNIYFCNVDELNVRTSSNLKSKVITTIKIGDPVRFIGGVGRKTVNATFNEIFSPEKYYEVELSNGVEGWVHGGALIKIPSKNELNFLK